MLDEINVVIVGDANIGKTALLTRACDGNFSTDEKKDSPMFWMGTPSSASTSVKVGDKTLKVNISDVPGSRGRMSNHFEQYAAFRSADVVVHAFEPSNTWGLNSTQYSVKGFDGFMSGQEKVLADMSESERAEARKRTPKVEKSKKKGAVPRNYARVREEGHYDRVPQLLVATAWDHKDRAVTEEEVQLAGQDNFDGYMVTSAKENTNIEAFVHLCVAAAMRIQGVACPEIESSVIEAGGVLTDNGPAKLSSGASEAPEVGAGSTTCTTSAKKTTAKKIESQGPSLASRAIKMISSVFGTDTTDKKEGKQGSSKETAAKEVSDVIRLTKTDDTSLAKVA